MKAIFKFICVASAMVLCLAACDKWTETESVTVEYPSLKEKNPALYEQYLKGVRTYKSINHQVMIVKFDNKETLPVGRGDHLSCLPDSVDYVILNNPEQITPIIAEEMVEIRKEKATKVLMNVSYPALEARYNAMIADEEQTHGSAVNTQERFVEWMAENVAKVVELCPLNGFDGLNVIYTGLNPNSMAASALELAKERQESFFGAINAWREENPNAVVFFEGVPKNVICQTEAVSGAKFIIAQAESVTNVTGLSYVVKQLIADDVPADRFVIGVTAIDITDPTNLNGIFGDTNAILGSAAWAVLPESDYTKAGVCVNHAQFDYYNVTKAYGNICKAISTMNPSPVK